MKIILASTSPYRQKQLREFGLQFTAVRPKADEEALKKELSSNPFRVHSPRAISRALSLEKALSLVADYPHAAILGADQLLDFDGEILGKPGNAANNIQMLGRLQGRTHKLITSMALVTAERRAINTVTAYIRMKTLSRKDISAYVQRDKAIDCAGGYRFERSGFSLIESMKVSDPSSLMGLSLIELPKLFLKLHLPIKFRGSIK